MITFYLNESCMAMFCKRDYGFKQNNSTCISCRGFEGDNNYGTALTILTLPYLHINNSCQKQPKLYLPRFASQTFRFHTSVETAIDHDCRNE